jgi:hypothetical protein
MLRLSDRSRLLLLQFAVEDPKQRIPVTVAESKPPLCVEGSG